MHISYSLLFQIMKERGMQGETLCQKAGISKSTLQKLKYPWNYGDVDLSAVMKVCRAMNLDFSEFTEMVDDDTWELRRIYTNKKYRNKLKKIKNSNFSQCVIGEQSDHFLITAAPGRGKTTTLVELVRKLAAHHDLLVKEGEAKNGDTKILVICFSKAAVAAVINKKLTDNENGSNKGRIYQVMTIDSFCGRQNYAFKIAMEEIDRLEDSEEQDDDMAAGSEAFRKDAEYRAANQKAGGSGQEKNSTSEQMGNDTHAPRQLSSSYEEQIKLFLDRVNDAYNKYGYSGFGDEDALGIWWKNFPRFRYVIVDELQDIRGIRARFLLQLMSVMQNCQFIFMTDPCQAIYDFSNEKEQGQESKQGQESIDSTSLFRKLALNETVRRYILDEKNHRLKNGSDLRWMEPWLAELRRPLSWHDGPWALHLLERMGNEKDVKKRLAPFALYDRQLCVPQGKNAVLTWGNNTALLVMWHFHQLWKTGQERPWFLLRMASHGDHKGGLLEMAGWIGLFFFSYPDKTISRNRFINHFNKIFPSDIRKKLNMTGKAEGYWEAVESCQMDTEAFYEQNDRNAGEEFPEQMIEGVDDFPISEAENLDAGEEPSWPISEEEESLLFPEFGEEMGTQEEDTDSYQVQDFLRQICKYASRQYDKRGYLFPGDMPGRMPSEGEGSLDTIPQAKGLEYDETFLPYHSLTLSTIHQAKGLEYDEVFLPHHIFHPAVYGNKEDIGEACRVSYVALTRAGRDVHFYTTAANRNKGIRGLSFSSYFGRQLMYEKDDLGHYAYPRREGRTLFYSRYGRADGKSIFLGFPFDSNNDVDPNSFDRQDVQQFIVHQIPIGRELFLYKSEEGGNKNEREKQEKVLYTLGLVEKDEETSGNVPSIIGNITEKLGRMLLKEQSYRKGKKQEFELPQVFDRLLVMDIVTYFTKKEASPASSRNGGEKTEKDNSEGEMEMLPEEADVRFWCGLVIRGIARNRSEAFNQEGFVMGQPEGNLEGDGTEPQNIQEEIQQISDEQGRDDLPDEIPDESFLPELDESDLY
ncbi:3'-5' exonuclease [Dialister succinatiphilus]|uniref:DNA 3'-5' helicase n=1 Tax=Dialister succinatiphilus YIT 11850 TaxID=742743 RepID=H1D2S7_9FIRM|nr:3'-5' exonuclease [Dialister succinatiphilus]EHO62197.1 hypothetical protein HMPREF9453_01915 [Dialister succinatiphilus YIT 11850]